MKFSKRKWISIASGTLAVLIAGVWSSEAFAYTVNNNLTAYGYVVKAYGSYELMGGNNVVVNTVPANVAGASVNWSSLQGQTINIAQEQASVSDGQGNWGVMLGDMQGADANNGYLLIADPSMGSTNVQSWVNRLGGNYNYVKNWLMQNNQQVQTTNESTLSPYTYDPFSDIVTQSGAKFGTKTTTPTGQTYQGNPVYLFTYPIYPSAPPTVSGLTVVDSNGQRNVVTQGDSITFQSNVNVPLWSGLAGYHYDAVQIKDDATGQTQWVVTGNGSYTINGINMQPVQGGSGTFSNEQLSPNTSFSTSSLTVGDTYTATEWVADGVHRMTKTPAAVNFTVINGPSVTLTANPTQLPTGQSSTLTATVQKGSSTDYIQIVDQSGDSTLHGSNSYADYQTGETSLTTTATDNQAQTVTYVAQLFDSNTGQLLAASSPVNVTWGQGSASIQFSPSTNTTVTSGTAVPLSYTTTGWQSGDTVTITPNSTGATNTWSTSADTNSSDSYTETENPQNGATDTVSYTATLLSSSGSVLATAQSGTISWTSSIPATTSLTLSANPTTLAVGSPTTLTVVVPPNPTGGAAPSGEFVQITDTTTGQYVGAGAYTGSSNFTYGFNSSGETETYTITYTSNVAGPQTFVAELWDPGVTPWNNPPALTSNTATVTWVKPTVTLSANPTNPFTGEASQLSYTTQGWASGDYVTITGSGGTDMWSESNDTQTSGTFTETENPTKGGTTPVQYTGNLYNSTGTLLSTSTLTVTWISPTITMTANPATNVPGQTSTLSYSVDVPLPSGYTVQITPTGNGAQMWNASGLTAQNGTDKETENPSAGQTIQVNYTASIISPSGATLATGSTQVKWVNAWTGTITLSASPQFLATGKSTTLTATTSVPVPSGYTLTIYDETTGQVVGFGNSSPELTQYSSFNAETDSFVAQLSDGYENVGNPSNTVTVVWSVLSLSANPTELPVNSSTTLSVTGQNVPNGDYLVIYNANTGQLVGYSQSTPYTVQVTETSPQTDQFIAYISTQSNSTGAYATSNPVNVNWYGVTITAVPSSLPVGKTSTVTATAANLPSGYVVDIKDTTTGQIVASGQPGQTVVQALQTRNQVETDNYIAQVVQPSNPPIPGMTVPPSTPPDGLFSVTSTEVQHYDPSTNTFGNIAGLPITVGSTVTNGWITGTVGQAQFDYGVYDPYNQTVYAIEFYSITNTSYWPPETYFNYEIFGYNLNTDTWTPIQYIEHNYLYGFFETEYFPDQMFYNPHDHEIYILYSRIDMYGDYTFQLDVINPNTTTLSSPLTQSGVYSYTYWVPSRRHGDGGWWTDNYWPYGSINLDSTTGNLYYTGFEWSYGYYQYGGILPEYLMEYVDSTGQAKVFPAQMDHSGIMGVGAAYDPNNGLIYFAGWYETQYAPFYTYDRLYSFNPTTNTTTDLGPMPNYNANDPLPNVNYINGHILVTNGSIYEYHPSSNTYTPAPFETAVVDSQLNQYAVPGATFYDSNFAWANYASNGGGQLSYGLSSKGPTLNIKYFPYWTFQQDMPSYVPSSLFPQQAVASGSGFWTESGNVPNGTAFFETNFDLPTAQTVTISNPLGNADGYEVVYIDGVPVLQNGNSAGTIPSQPGATTGTSISLSLPAGMHQVIIEGVNTNGFSSASPNSAAVGLQIVSQSGQTLVSNTASSWMTTGYVQQLPAGWFSGAIGTFNWTEYILQENPSQPIDQQQSFSVTTTTANVSVTSTPVSVTWYQYALSLSASPTSLPAGDPTTLTATAGLGVPSGSKIEIYNQTTNKVVGTSTAGATSYSAPYTETTPTTDTFIAYIVDPSNGSQVASSNTVQVTWTQVKLTLSNADVYHTPGWQKNLDTYNTYYSTHDPSLVRTESTFWAGEELMFKVQPSIPTISQAEVFINGLTYSPYAPMGLPSNLTIPLTYDANTGYLEGHTDPNLGVTINGIPQPDFEFLQNGTYTVQFWVKSSDNQVATATAQFTIDAPWVSGNDPKTFFYIHETY